MKEKELGFALGFAYRVWITLGEASDLWTLKKLGKLGVLERVLALMQK